MSKKVAILGAAGQLGIELEREFRTAGWKTSAWDRNEVDITDAAAVEAAIGALLPDVVVNSAAYNMVDVAEHEPQAAFLVNASAVRNIALACRQADAMLVHFSTDYVFDGTANRPYVETDAPHPLGAYAVSKLAGEYYARAYLDRALVIRTSGVFGPGGLRTARGNFIELILRQASEHRVIRVVEDHVASPTYAPALANRTVAMVERDLTGIVHCGGGRAVSWYEYASIVFREAGLKPTLHPTNEMEFRTAARRPRYSALSNAYIESLGIPPMPPFEAAIRSYLQLRERFNHQA